MSRRRRSSFVVTLPLLLVVASPAAASEAPRGKDVAKIVWSWLAAVLNVPATPSCDHGSQTDPNGRCLQVAAQETITCDHGSSTDPNGRCFQSPPGGPLG